MKLSDLKKYQEIVIQCHDNPDADAIASGFVLARFFQSQGKRVRFLYSGEFQITKSNLVYFVEQLKIPIEYVKELPEKPELLLMTDCQYGEGNVRRFEAEHVAVIDHHQVAGALPRLHEVRSNLGSCCTIVWDMLKKEKGFSIDKEIGTALYYGLYTDTNSFSEIAHPLDKDMRDAVPFDKSLIMKLRNMNLSLGEAKIAGIALLGVEYYEENRYAILESEPCDPNILGIISDFFLAVDTVDICLVYSILPVGIKFSIRSCTKETRADELAEYLAHHIGSGGGHTEKAGGFIQYELLGQRYKKYASSGSGSRDFIVTTILRERMDNYFKSFEVIYAADTTFDTADMDIYKKIPVTVGWVDPEDFISEGNLATVRTLEGDLDILVREDTVIMIGLKGEVYPITGEKFNSSYRITDTPLSLKLEYEPTIKDTVTGEVFSLISHASSCIARGNVRIFARKLEKTTKIFTEWDEERYMLGKKGDYLAVREDDPHDIYIIEKTIFKKSYEKIGKPLAPQAEK